MTLPAGTVQLNWPYRYLIGDYDSGNYMVFNAATGKFRRYGTFTTWDDLRFPSTRIRQGATAKPDFDITNIGLLFPQDDATEIAYLLAQMPHDWKEGSAIYPHMHYIQSVAEQPVFKIDYK